ncbi:hypothetical protein ASG12_17945 [Williamsia sp. Leaf354]|uniref:hypothetical protein n=1 Tax=Williamsia sp. Leaf354 TaxID=1736349 RepID=UPI0006F1CE81|nr:hypothetical protein [Williamsia sp. Leaf354]KQR96104.1 hypothetical protein ASG12_17945 [Williamsia sp. Leaf354]
MTAVGSRLSLPGAVIGAGAAAVWLGALVGWALWWVSSVVTVVVVLLLVAVVVGGVGPVSRRRRNLLAATTLVLAMTLGAVVAVSATHLVDRRSVDHAAATAARDAGPLVCRVVDRGTAAARATAIDAATADLADRLRSGAGALDGPQSSGADVTAGCVPVEAGVAAVSGEGADVVVAVNVTERQGADTATVGRVLAAHLRRVDDRWRVATLEVLR